MEYISSRALVLCALSGIAASGCLTSQSLESARTLEAGRSQVLVAPAVGVVGAFSPFEQSFELIGLPIEVSGQPLTVVPMFDVGVRHGVTDSVEVSGRLGVSGLTGGAKFQLYRSPSVAVAFAPSLGVGTHKVLLYDVGRSVITLRLDVPVLVGVIAGDGHEIVFGPLLAPEVDLSRYGAPNAALFMGGQFGVALRPLEHLRVMPEISVAYPVVAVDSLNIPQSPRVQMALGVMFGG